MQYLSTNITFIDDFNRQRKNTRALKTLSLNNPANRILWVVALLKFKHKRVEATATRGTTALVY
jgi:hypothetical protein